MVSVAGFIHLSRASGRRWSGARQRSVPRFGGSRKASSAFWSAFGVKSKGRVGCVSLEGALNHLGLKPEEHNFFFLFGGRGTHTWVLRLDTEPRGSGNSRVRRKGSSEGFTVPGKGQRAAQSGSHTVA